MLTKLPPIHIPKYWELIKMSVINADGIPSFDAAVYSKELLIKLLCRKYICIIMHKDNNIQALCIFEIKEINNTKKRVLQMHSLYAIQRVPDDDWVEAMDQIKKFADVEGCERIYGFTKNKRVKELLELTGYSGEAQYFVHHL